MSKHKCLVAAILHIVLCYAVPDVPIKVRMVGDVPFETDQINYRLPNNTKPDAYDISIITDIDQGIFEFSGSVTIYITALTHTDSITLHARQLNVTSFTLKSKSGKRYTIAPPDYDKQTEFLTFRILNDQLLAGEKVALIIKYNGVLRSDQSGFYWSSYNDNNGKRV